MTDYNAWELCTALTLSIHESVPYREYAVIQSPDDELLYENIRESPHSAQTLSQHAPRIQRQRFKST